MLVIRFAIFVPWFWSALQMGVRAPTKWEKWDKWESARYLLVKIEDRSKHIPRYEDVKSDSSGDEAYLRPLGKILEIFDISNFVVLFFERTYY